MNGILRGLFDVIFTNPPFGQTLRRTLKVAESQPSYAGKDSADTELLDLYELGEKSTKIQHIFLERCLALLKPGGRMGIVLPEGFFNTPTNRTSATGPRAAPASASSSPSRRKSSPPPVPR